MLVCAEGIPHVAGRPWLTLSGEKPLWVCEKETETRSTAEEIELVAMRLGDGGVSSVDVGVARWTYSGHERSRFSHRSFLYVPYYTTARTHA